ncbi:modulator of macroautophagy TMEM150B isoform 4-T4 [Liasis olivaceus]
MGLTKEPRESQLATILSVACHQGVLSPCGFGRCFLCSWLCGAYWASGLYLPWQLQMAPSTSQKHFHISGVVICFLKYQQVRDYGCHSPLNLAGLILGILCALGASLVGNFQQYNQLEVHLTGAFLAFVVGILYFWVQTFLTNQVKPRHGGRWIGPLRFFLSSCGSALIISTVALFFMRLDSEAAYCEWALAMDLFLLFGLFVVDFRHMGGCSVHVHHRFADENSQHVQTSVQTLSL